MARGMRRSTQPLVISARYIPEEQDDAYLGIDQVLGSTNYDRGFEVVKPGTRWGSVPGRGERKTRP